MQISNIGDYNINISNADAMFEFPMYDIVQYFNITDNHSWEEFSQFLFNFDAYYTFGLGNMDIFYPRQYDDSLRYLPHDIRRMNLLFYGEYRLKDIDHMRYVANKKELFFDDSYKYKYLFELDFNILNSFSSAEKRINKTIYPSTRFPGEYRINNLI